MTTSTLQTLGLGLLTTCFAHSATAQTWQSVVTPNAGAITVNALAFDAANNLVVTGSFTGTVQLGFFSLTSLGSSDVFIAKLSPAGVWMLANRAGGTGADQATALVRDANDDFIVTGQFGSPSFTIGATTLPNTTAAGNVTDVFIARWTATGGWDRAAAAGSVGYDYASGIGIDANGTATVVGSFTGATLRAGAQSATNTIASGASSDVFAARWDDTWIQVTSFGGSGDEEANAVAVLPDGEAVVVGAFASALVTVGTTPLTNANQLDPEADAVVAWLSPAGVWTRAVQAGAAGADNLRAVQVEAGGGLVVAGDFTGATTTFGPQTLTNADPSGVTSDVVVARLSPAGAWTQAVRAGSTHIDYATGLANGVGGTYVTGSFYGPLLELGPQTLANTSASAGEVFVAQLQPGGTWTNAVAAGGPGDDYATSLLADAQGQAYVGGVVSSQGAQFGPVAVAAGGQTGYVAKLGGLPTATRSAQALAGLTVFPNPVRQGAGATLRYEGPSRGPVQVTVLDALGRAVANGVAGQQGELSTAALPVGMYLVRVQAGAEMSYQRLVVE